LTKLTKVFPNHKTLENLLDKTDKSTTKGGFAGFAGALWVGY
jgi:hypothetical protein